MTEPAPGIPEAARERLEEVRQSGGSFFTSGLAHEQDVDPVVVLRQQAAGIKQ